MFKTTLPLEMTSPREYKLCPDCAEEILAAARKCRYCGYRFDNAPLERQSLLAGLFNGSARRKRDVSLVDILAEWGFTLGKFEEVSFFHLAAVARRSGYLLVTSERLAFFPHGSRGAREDTLERPLRDISEVRVLEGRIRRRLELSGPEFQLLLHGLGAAEVALLTKCLSEPPQPA